MTEKLRLITVFVVAAVVSLSGVSGVRAASTCPTPLAHRGVHAGDIDENSLASIRAMKDRGAAEVDLRVTNDGALVLMHDAGVNRTTNGEGLVIDLTLAQIKDLRLEKSGDLVPTFREAVRAAERSNVRLVVELKQYQQWTDELFTRMGKIANGADVRVYVGGMGRGFLTTIPQHANWVYWRPADGIEPTPSNAAEYDANLILDRIRKWTRPLVRAAEEAGYQTGVRLTNHFAKANRLGVEYVLTNRPARLLAFCRSLP